MYGVSVAVMRPPHGRLRAFAILAQSGQPLRPISAVVWLWHLPVGDSAT
jgi:hypothetical protein